MQEWVIEKPWLESHCGLGEGPFYERETDSLRFVDIKNKRLHYIPLTNPSPSALETLQFDVRVTVTSDIQGVDPRERILIGVKNGIAVLNRKTGQIEDVASFSETRNERVRSNDGASDPHGRFWLGSMTDFDQGEFRSEGSLFLFQGKATGKVFLRDLTIPNSVGWSPDNKTMYFTHSSSGQVLALDYSMETGAVSNQRVFYQHDGSGDPDGFRVDVEGNLWHAVYGESRVLKISAASGKVVGQVTLPTRNITCVEFVGTELLITTAADEDSGDSVSQEYGGAVFRVDVGVQGLRPFGFKLE
jgi:sugar lactone lactonase YvrE